MRVLRHLGGLRRIAQEMHFRLVANQKVIPVFTTARGLHEVTKLAIQHPSAGAAHDLPRLFHDLRHQATLIALTVGIGGPRYRHPLAGEKGNE